MNLRVVLVIIGSLFHGVLMVIATLFVLTIGYTMGDEVLLIELTSAFKNMVMKHEAKPPREKFLFVSVTYEKYLLDKLDSVGFPIGKHAITDRRSIGQFLQRINNAKSPHKMMLLDIFFVDPSPDDSLVRVELARAKNTIVSYHKKDNGKPDYPIFKAELGLSDMITDNDMVLKYHIMHSDSLKTSALKMYEMIHNAKLEHGSIYDKMEGKYIMNSFILDYAIRRYDLFNAPDSLRYPMVYMSELLSVPPDMFDKMVKDKIIIVGDLEGIDNHKTIYGSMPGPLILLNAYLSLEQGDNVISPYFILMLWLVYSLISIKILWVDNPLTVYLKTRFGEENVMVGFLLDASFLMLYFVIVSVTSYLVFGIHLAILFFTVYFDLLQSLIKFISKIVDKGTDPEGEQKDKNATAADLEQEAPSK